MEMGTGIRHVVLACLFVLTVALIAAMFLEVRIFPTNDWSPFILQDTRLKTSVQSLDTIFSMEFKELFKDTARAVYEAKKHVRGCKTSTYLRQAITIMDEILSDLHIDKETLIEKPTVTSRNICPDVFMGTTFGYPMYHHGMEIRNCSYGKPVRQLVTIVSYFNQAWGNVTDDIARFLQSVQRESKMFNVVVAVGNDVKAKDITVDYPRVKIIYTGNISDGAVWNTAIQHVTTEYALLARDAEQFTNDSHLERHVREIESLGATVTGSATRTPDGKWRTSCFQAVYKNYTLKYFEGYDESKHECMFCDFLTGPFVVPVANVRKYKFGDMDENEGLFEDWFLRLSQTKQIAILCPDSMFHVKYRDTKPVELDAFMDKWQLYKMTNHRQESVTSKCSKSALLPPSMGMMTPVCVLQAKAHAVIDVMKICEENDVICELADETLLGAVKMNKIIPWGKNYDVSILSDNLTSVLNLKSQFIEHHFKLNIDYSNDSTRVKVISSAPLLAKTTIWIKQMKRPAEPDILSQRLIPYKPTRILFHGHWLRVARNPGLTVREQYGTELYRHVDDTHDGDSVGRFVKCETSGHHACMDRYNADGNLQFADVYP